MAFLACVSALPASGRRMRIRRASEKSAVASAGLAAGILFSSACLDLELLSAAAFAHGVVAEDAAVHIRNVQRMVRRLSGRRIAIPLAMWFHDPPRLPYDAAAKVLVPPSVRKIIDAFARSGKRLRQLAVNWWRKRCAPVHGLLVCNASGLAVLVCLCILYDPP